MGVVGKVGKVYDGCKMEQWAGLGNGEKVHRGKCNNRSIGD